MQSLRYATPSQQVVVIEILFDVDDFMVTTGQHLVSNYHHLIINKNILFLQ